MALPRGRLLRLATVVAASISLHPRDSPVSKTKHSWRLVDGHHWQIASEASETPAQTDVREGTRGGCPDGMVEVEGAMKTEGDIESLEYLQDATCLEWIDRKFPERCARFDRDAWLRLSDHLPTRRMRFCIDRFEYPDENGVYPIIDVTWSEARALCAVSGKRLCTEAEWTFACEGEEATPYPNAYVRDPTACVIDRPWRDVNEHDLGPRESAKALVEIDRLWQGEPSGTHPRCRSAFGVYDMTGNIDEWTISVRGAQEPRSILKGGYWGPVRTRCRPSTRAHGEDYSYYQQGFRCCRDR